MQSRVSRGLSALTLGLFWLLAAPLATWGQVSFNPPPAPASVSVPSGATPVDSLLERGRKLEGERRWGEALTLYEEGLREFPKNVPLTEHFTLARMHYDLGRRYSDATFRDALQTLPVRDGLDLYSEVLAKINAHYVHVPDWNSLWDVGTQSLEAALLDPVFLERNLPEVPKAQVEWFRRELRPQLDRRNPDRRVETRQEARELVSWAAQLGRTQLGLNETAVVLEYVSGTTAALDPYSTYLTAGQLNEVYSQIEGNFVGLGVELKAADGALLIVKVIPGSPAERGGIRGGDQIVAVDGRATSDMSTDQAANMLQGKEGTQVDVTATSPGMRPRTMRIRREQVEVPSIDNAKILDATFGIAYLKLTCFQKTTSRDLDTALWKLHNDGMRHLIIDLRGNPGGLLTTSVDVADRFVEQGTIVSTRGRSPQEDYNYSARQAGTWRVPLTVLIDGESASASEIFAGAIRDHKRGLIVGTRSYGKGSVQGIFPLNVANSGLRLTTAKFYSPKGLPYSDVGVSPDLLVQQTARPTETGQLVSGASDPVIEAALREARQQMARR